MTNTEIETRKVFMVNAYSAHNVCFMFIGTQTINNTALNNFDIADDNDLNPYKYSNTLNIFIHKVLKDGDTRPRGNAYSIPNTEGYLSLGGNAGMPTMAHEMGHVFGLFHTFEPHPWDPLHGKESVERNSGNSCFDCDEDGDYVCDTPADPDQDEGGYMANNINASCIYTGNRSDECGMFYTPSTNNIMSYCPDGCRTTFTPGQASRFLTIIANQPDFEPRMAPDTKNVGSPFPIIDNGGFQNYYAKLLINVFGYYYAIGSSQVLMQAKKIVINNNTHLSPSTGKIVIRPFVGCN
jgi:hypothetical protein